MPNEAFSYAKINENLPVIRDNIFAVSFPDSNYIGMLQIPEHDWDERTMHRSGLVWYISIDDTPSNLEKAWDVLKDIFILYKLTFVMVPKKGYRLENSADNGRQITIFQFLNPEPASESGLEALAKDITLALKQVNIAPSRRPMHAKEIKGSDYLACYDNYEDIKSKNEERVPGDVKGKVIARSFSKDSDKRYDLPKTTDFLLAFNLLFAYQIFYELDNRLYMNFISTGYEDKKGKHVQFRGDVTLAKKIAKEAFKHLGKIAIGDKKTEDKPRKKVHKIVRKRIPKHSSVSDEKFDEENSNKSTALSP